MDKAQKPTQVDMSVSLCGIKLQNPVVTASGTFGFGREYAAFYPLSELGAITCKGVTPTVRLGNPPPRIAETPNGMLNSVGLQNPGVDAFLADELPWLRRQNVPVIVNLSAGTIQDFEELAEKLTVPGIDLLEVNISCPNVKRGGMSFGTDPGEAEAVTLAVKAHTDLPVLVKLTPNVTSIADIAAAAENGGADGISMINTLLGMRIDLHTRRPVLKNNTGGLSGPAILPVAVRCIHDVYTRVSIPILGMGGVTTGQAAAELMMAGASAVAVGSATIADPYAPIRIRDELEAFCVEEKIPEVASLTGTLEVWSS